MSVAAIIQARMGSSRLPGKTLMSLGKCAVLDWVTTRVAAAPRVDEVVIATTTNDEDDQLADHAAGSADRVVRGHPTDVLARYEAAMSDTTADTIIRITADCPFIDPDLIELGLEIFERTEAQYVATDLDGRMPHGVDLEVVARAALERAAELATDPVEREHVTPYIVRRPDEFAHSPLIAPVWARRPDLRFTLDEQADYDLLAKVVAETNATPSTLRTRDVVSLLDRRPDIAAINGSVSHNVVT